MEDVVSDGRRTRQVRFLTTRTPGEEVPRLQPARCERGVLLAALPLDGAGAPPNAPQDPPLGSQRAGAGGERLTPEQDTPRCSGPQRQAWLQATCACIGPALPKAQRTVSYSATAASKFIIISTREPTFSCSRGVLQIMPQALPRAFSLELFHTVTHLSLPHCSEVRLWSERC